MRALTVAYGETHAVRQVDDENGRRTLVILECGSKLEIDQTNSNRFHLNDRNTIGCKMCQDQTAPKEDEIA